MRNPARRARQGEQVSVNKTGTAKETSLSEKHK